MTDNKQFEAIAGSAGILARMADDSDLETRSGGALAQRVEASAGDEKTPSQPQDETKSAGSLPRQPQKPSPPTPKK